MPRNSLGGALGAAVAATIQEDPPEPGIGSRVESLLGGDVERAVKGLLPTPTPTLTTVAKGATRFNNVMASAPSIYGKGTRELDEWILALKEDPTDMEYTRLLREAKAQVKERQRVQAQDKALREEDQIFKGKLKSEAKHRRETEGKPILRGMPVSEADVFGEVAGIAGESPFLAAFRQANEIPVNRNSAQVLARSGFYVYTGQAEDPAGGRNFTRDTYMYVEDAKSLLAGMPERRLAGYQKKLGLPATGMLDPDIQRVWDTAVGIAQTYARAGKKVEIEFVFEGLVDQLAAEGGLGGSGGGGGSSFAGETDEEIVAIDYYRAMMQVLGDISGVQESA